MRSGEENGFIHGVAHCVSTLVEDHMEDAAWRIIQRTEFDVFAFIDAGVEQDELLAIKYLFAQYGR